MPGESDQPPLSKIRVVIAILGMLLALTYAVGIVSGYIPQNRRIDAVSLGALALIAVVILVALRPDQAERFKLFEISGFKIEMLESVRRRQAEQAIQLQDMSDMLPLLLPTHERTHLCNLATNTPITYQGNHNLRSELRHLRSFELIKMRPDKTVGAMKDGTSFDLRDFVELTELGKRWAKRIVDIDRGDHDLVVSHDDH